MVQDLLPCTWRQAGWRTVIAAWSLSKLGNTWHAKNRLQLSSASTGALSYTVEILELAAWITSSIYLNVKCSLLHSSPPRTCRLQESILSVSTDQKRSHAESHCVFILGESSMGDQPAFRLFHLLWDWSERRGALRGKVLVLPGWNKQCEMNSAGKSKGDAKFQHTASVNNLKKTHLKHCVTSVKKWACFCR